MTSSPDTMQVTCQEKAPDDWDELLAVDPAVDYFHTRFWMEAAARHWPGVQPLWLCARRGQRLVGGMVAVHHSGRVDHLENGLDGTSGGPLVDVGRPREEQQRIFQALISLYLKQRRGSLQSTCLTFNAEHESRWGHLVRASGKQWQVSENPGAVIPLAGGPEVVSSRLMKRSKRNERNRALRRGVTIEVTNDGAVLDEYYPLLESASRVWGKAPTPLAFLKELLQDRERVYFVSTRREGKLLGGHLNLLFGDRVIAWNGVTDREYAKEFFPATLAIWGDIIQGCERGAQILDLGGSGGLASLARFKKSFGAKIEMRGHYVRESRTLEFLRHGKKFLDRLKSDGAEPNTRWHDTPSAGDDSASGNSHS